MRDFEIKRADDGSFVLLNSKGEWIDGRLIKDDGRSVVSVRATARTDTGQEFYTTLPVTRELIKHAPDLIEERLRLFAEHWARDHEAAA